jgi:hypothetical protein
VYDARRLTVSAFEFAGGGGGNMPFSQSSLAARDSQPSRMR